MLGMWLLRAVNLTLAAYLGGLVASYAILLATPESLTSPTLAVYPFWFALGILIFTLPGALWVAAIFRMVQSRWSLAGSYGFAGGLWRFDGWNHAVGSFSAIAARLWNRGPLRPYNGIHVGWP